MLAPSSLIFEEKELLVWTFAQLEQQSVQASERTYHLRYLLPSDYARVHCRRWWGVGSVPCHL